MHTRVHNSFFLYLILFVLITIEWNDRYLFPSIIYPWNLILLINLNNVSLVSTLFIVAMHKYVERKLTVDNDDVYIYINIRWTKISVYFNVCIYIYMYRFGEIMAVRKRWNDYWQSHGDILKSTRWKFNKTRLETITIEWDSAFCNLFDACAEFKSVFEFAMEEKKKKKKENGAGARYENLKQLLQYNKGRPLHS